jgi:ABC-type transporter MlaC component
MRSRGCNMRGRNLFHAGFVIVAVLTSGAVASGREGALAFIQKEHGALTSLLRQPPSPSRDVQVDATLGNFVDYDEFARRAFGQPCPRKRPNCTSHWAALTPAQRAEVTPLLKKLVMRNERRNVLKTIDYDVEYKGARESEAESTVRMEARSKLQPRDPPLLFEYVAIAKDDTWHVVDIVTEGSSRTTNYYEQFDRMLSDSSKGYPYVIAKLKEKIAKKDTETQESK